MGFSRDQKYIKIVFLTKIYKTQWSFRTSVLEVVVTFDQSVLLGLCHHTVYILIEYMNNEHTKYISYWVATLIIKNIYESWSYNQQGYFCPEKCRKMKTEKIL